MWVEVGVCAVSLNCKTQVGFHVLPKHVDHCSIFLFIFTACLLFFFFFAGSGADEKKRGGGEGGESNNGGRSVSEETL